MTVSRILARALAFCAALAFAAVLLRQLRKSELPDRGETLVVDQGVATIHSSSVSHPASTAPNNTYAWERLARAPGGSVSLSGALKRPAPAALVAFEVWLGEYSAANGARRATLMENGRHLFDERMQEFARIIETDPELALMHALDDRHRALVPAEWSDRVERIVSGEGFFGVKAICHHGVSAAHGEGCRIEHDVIVDHLTLRAFIYGGRRERLTEENASIYGVVLGKSIALHEDDVVALGGPGTSRTLVYKGRSEVVPAGTDPAAAAQALMESP